MKIDINNLYLGDTRELIKNIPDETIDCIVSDIPYKLIAGDISVEKKAKDCLLIYKIYIKENL